MSADGLAQTRGTLWTSVASLFATSSPSCAAPFQRCWWRSARAWLLGAGAALPSLVSVFPQVAWLSEHKEAIFVFAGLARGIFSWLQWRGRSAPALSTPGCATPALPPGKSR